MFEIALVTIGFVMSNHFKHLHDAESYFPTGFSRGDRAVVNEGLGRKTYNYP